MYTYSQLEPETEQTKLVYSPSVGDSWGEGKTWLMVQIGRMAAVAPASFQTCLSFLDMPKTKGMEVE